MVDLTGIQRVIARIEEIKARFNVNREKSFGGILENAINEYETKLNKEKDNVPEGDISEKKAKEIIKRTARALGVDADLALAVAKAESNFRQNAVSNKGAVGIMQLMPTTATSLGVNPYDIKENVLGGVFYLKNLLERYDGDVVKALAAYNAGPFSVEKHGGIPPFRETQEYVEKVMKYYMSMKEN
ncbi:Transglycosylase SLT domain-containing protein [Caldanaerovirga acetigignens]|uniref:Transglycosylase SLT domain-containing protein n=1 Tax=Caldanaerovirga acetigignens TaxID=447595 RepID=A0A1M7I788_9FIRM|nr:lytic transglycosylase domain-containing protein [Caldanaerovirga acetigignens]SHM36545.1 Transglycosylase SLT domain-containing protein [Caldanaerovirga acetigignens]